jgi:hypothetical protein
MLVFRAGGKIIVVTVIDILDNIGDTIIDF